MNNQKLANTLKKIVKELKAFNNRELDDILDVCDDLGIDYELNDDYLGKGGNHKTTNIIIDKHDFKNLTKELDKQNISCDFDNLFIKLI